MINRVHWTTEERITVANACLEGVNASDYSTFAAWSSESSSKILNLVREAQKVLPEDRQRVLKGTHNLLNFMTDLERAFARYSLVQRVEHEAVANQPTADQEVESALATLEKHLPEFADKIASIVATKVLSAFAESFSHVSEALAQNKAPALKFPTVGNGEKHDPNPTPEVRAKRLIIGVFGLKPNQQNALKSQFKDVVIKSFWRYPLGTAPHADYMIGAAGFIDHPEDKKAFKAYGSRYIRVSGGETAIANKVRKLQKQFEEEQNVQA